MKTKRRRRLILAYENVCLYALYPRKRGIAEVIFSKCVPLLPMEYFEIVTTSFIGVDDYKYRRINVSQRQYNKMKSQQAVPAPQPVVDDGKTTTEPTPELESAMM